MFNFGWFFGFLPVLVLLLFLEPADAEEFLLRDWDFPSCFSTNSLYTWLFSALSDS